MHIKIDLPRMLAWELTFSEACVLSYIAHRGLSGRSLILRAEIVHDLGGLLASETRASQILSVLKRKELIWTMSSGRSQRILLTPKSRAWGRETANMETAWNV